MKVDLDREDLLCLLKGTAPHYSLFGEVTIQTCGYFVGGFKDEWHWNNEMLNKLPDEGLYRLYILCKSSWEKDLRKESLNK